VGTRKLSRNMLDMLDRFRGRYRHAPSISKNKKLKKKIGKKKKYKFSLLVNTNEFF